ncbi:C2H2 type zinc finger domain protein [Aspergillus clavatus NRRL 1]|uniref:C2H2 type zinc finger domain protein n=1 Tax=Aspergillus clavatus (strain ATCC 1007 / CBS 513.65 / DSM 816 / NCTC 3887 / NRRL 1 / QM 1276 / 107) TaxID=344612 RepID=A1C9Y2_ASPCL|nr:C2H2 type zinc finger domain protein [Aspergillus clavatus NRRL 1]EAW12550.1 C2H2 type zinc finger domain protein [Aspergillus clavatus NRRL 1]
MSKRPRSASPTLSAGQSSHTVTKSPSPASSAHSTERSKMVLQDTAQPAVEVMRCSLPPHRDTLSFSSYEDYEVHYRKTHVNRCSECGKNFPTDRYLDLHIEEVHDPLIAAKRDKGEKTYSCFIEDCERKCSTPQKRRMHLIDKHMFPRTYNFYIVKDGIDEQTSMLRSPNAQRRRISATATAPSPQEGRLRNRRTSESYSPVISHPTSRQPVAQQTHEEPEIAQLERSMSALRFVPTSVVKSQGRTGSRP